MSILNRVLEIDVDSDRENTVSVRIFKQYVSHRKTIIGQEWKP